MFQWHGDLVFWLPLKSNEYLYCICFGDSINLLFVMSRQHTDSESFKIVSPVFKWLSKTKRMGFKRLLLRTASDYWYNIFNRAARSGRRKTYRIIRSGFHHKRFILSLALKCHPKTTIVFIFIFDSSFLTLLNHVPFWWAIRPSTIPFFFTPWVPNFNQTFKGSIIQLHFINKQKTFDWFIVIIYASCLLEKLDLTLRLSLD